jgi:hypothetical protein
MTSRKMKKMEDDLKKMKMEDDLILVFLKNKNNNLKKMEDDLKKRRRKDDIKKMKKWKTTSKENGRRTNQPKST